MFKCNFSSLFQCGPRDLSYSLMQRWATLFGLRATLERKMAYAGQYKHHMDLNALNFERKWAYSCLFSKKKHFKIGILMFYQLKKMFAGHIKVLRGPHVARGPDVAQAWSNATYESI